MTTQSEAIAAIRDTKPVVAGPLVAVRVSEDLYLVQSYGQTIAAVVRGLGYMVTTAKYSQTTSKHAGMIRRAWDGLAMDVTQEKLDAALRTRR